MRPQHTVGDLRQALDGVELDDETLDTIDEQIRRRSAYVAHGEPL